MELELTNSQSEMLVVGSFYKEPTLYLTYGTSIVPKYDFSDKACEFFISYFLIIMFHILKILPN